MRKMIFPIVTEEEEKLPFYITSIGANENQYHVQRPDGYPNFHFLYSTTGTGRLLIDNKEFSIDKNMGFFFHPSIPHEYFAEIEPWTTWWITFDGYAAERLIERMGFCKYEVFLVSDMEKLHNLHGDVHAAATFGSLSMGHEVSHMLYRFLLEMKSCLGTDTMKTRYGKSRQLLPLLVYIEENFGSTISLEDMAQVTGVTPQHLCRLFKQAFHMRPFEYLTRFRLKKAKEILVSTGNPLLKEVAAATGYNDTSYFCSVFKQFEGMTPLEFKRMHRE